MTGRLSPSVVANAKPGFNPITKQAIDPSKPYKLADGRGLFLLVQPTGSKLWRWKYRRPVTRSENLLSFGAYPDVPLKRAREKRDDARKLLSDGIDPGTHRKASRAAGQEAAANTFEVVAREWLELQTWVNGYKTKVEAWFKNDVFPWIGKQPVIDLTAADFIGVCTRVQQRGALESAYRIWQNCNGVMRYAVATSRIDRNPVMDVKPGDVLRAPGERHHPAITDPTEIGALLRSIDGYEGSPTVKCALQLAPLVFVRPGELRHMEWAEVDLDKAEWNIPASKMKMRQPHLVPLSTQAVTLLQEQQQLTGRGQYVLPGGRSPKRPMSDNALNAAFRRMGYEVGTVTAHGWRATARTVLDEVLGCRVDLIEHQLAHAVRDPNGRAYNRTSHLPERRKMMQTWADYLDTLRIGENVIPFARKAS